MSRTSFVLGLVMTLAAVQPAVAEPLAVRVEVEVLGPAPSGVRVAVTVQVSPEDRGRIGANAMLEVQLDGAAPPGQSPMWAVRMADDGSARIETAWPPGEHELQVRISSPNRRESGLWVGTVRIPRPDEGAQDRPGAAVQSAAQAEPELKEELDAADAPEGPTAGAADRDPAPSAALAAASGAAVAAADGVSGAAAGASPGSEPPLPTGEERAGDPREEPAEEGAEALVAEAVPPKGAAPPTAAPVAAGGAVAAMVEAAPHEEAAPPTAAPASAEEAAGMSAEAEAPVEAAPPMAATAAAEQTVEMATEPMPSEEAVEVAAGAAPAAEVPQPIIEPLRGDPAPSPAPGPPAVPAALPPPPALVASAHAGWKESESGAAEVTAVVLRGREPARDLQPDALLLRVGGVEVPIEALGGAGNAPLLLGIAVDAAADSGVGWPGAGDLAPLTDRASEGLGSSFYAAAGGAVGEWGSEPPAAVPGGTGGDVASLVVDSLRRFDGTRGRRFLLVVTDGRNEPAKEAWREAVTAAGEAGTPVLVVALWDEGFSRRTRNNLREIAEVSGGSLFLVQGRSQLDRAAERFGPLLDAGVAVRFVVPAGTALPARVVLESNDREIEVSAPRFIR